MNMDKTIGEVQKTIKLLEKQYYDTTDEKSREKIRKKFNRLHLDLEKLVRSQLDSHDPKYREQAEKLKDSEKQLESLKKELLKYQTAFVYLLSIFRGINFLIRRQKTEEKKS